MDKLRILIFGAGAIGTYVGGSLALTGHQVIFIERPQVVKKLRRQGLKLLLGVGRKQETKPFTPGPTSHIFFEPSVADALKHVPFDLGIFAIKSFDTDSALRSLRQYADQMPPILCLQNGVDNEPSIAAVLGSNKVIAGTVTSSVGRRAEGDIVLERLRGVGIADGHPLSRMVSAALNAAGLNACLFPCARDMKWSKMLTNLIGNASAAILDMAPAEIFSCKGLCRMEVRMLREAHSVMKVLGIHTVNLPGTPVQALMTASLLPDLICRPLLVKAVGGGRGRKMPSFHIDLHAGRGKSEVNWLNGAVVRFGMQAGVQTPINHVLNETLQALTDGKIPPGTYSRQPDKLLALMKQK